MDKKFKEPLLAFLLSLALPGAGQIYVEKKILGLFLLLGTILLGGGAMAYVLNPSIKVSPYCLIPLAGCVCLFLFSLADSYFSAKKYNTIHGLTCITPPDGKKMLIAGIAGAILFYLLMLWFILTHACYSFTVPRDSMEPTIYGGERVLVNLMAYKISKPQRGDIVIYKYPQNPSKTYIHRIVAFPGESVELKDHKIIINGVQITDDWAVKVRHYNGGKLAKRGMKPVVVDPDSYYVLGDNAARSEDSRAWGFLPKKNIIGKVYKIYYPSDRSGPVE